MSRISFLFPALSLFMLTVPGLQGQLTIAGTDLLGEDIQTAIQAELQTTGLDVVFAMNGSLLATESLANGEADAAIVAIPAGTQAPSGRAMDLAFQVVTIAVHETNPLREIGYSELRRIYQEGGSITGWGDLVSDLAWQDRKISLVAGLTDDAITLQVFNAVVLDGSPLTESIRYTSVDAEQVERIIEEDTAVLFLLPAMEGLSGIRLLGLREEDTQQAYTPSKDNVYYGDYPLRLPFQLVISAELDAASANALIRAVYSPGVTRVLEAGHFMTLPLPEREAVLSRLD